MGVGCSYWWGGSGECKKGTMLYRGVLEGEDAVCWEGRVLKGENIVHGR